MQNKECQFKYKSMRGEFSPVKILRSYGNYMDIQLCDEDGTTFINVPKNMVTYAEKE